MFKLLSVASIFGLICTTACGASGDVDVLSSDATGVSNAQALQAAAAAAAVPQPSCVLTVPANALTARGLATPYVLEAPCQEANAAVYGAFVQALILDPATGALSVYNPLVIDAGDTPLIAPTLPTLPANAVVGIWFGFNGTTLILSGATNSALADAKCINGLGSSYFGQVAACNAPAFFAAAQGAIAAKAITVPRLGTGKDGQECPTTRDFSVVDQDPSDNVTTSYLVDAKGHVAQNTPGNMQTLQRNGVSFTVINNGSDNALLAEHIDPALGCTPWRAPDITNPQASVNNSTTWTASQALNELSANTWHSIGSAPGYEVALVESGDEMVLVNDRTSSTKMNLYRSLVDQPANVLADDRHFCEGLAYFGAPRIAAEAHLTAAAATLDPAVGTNLYTFLVGRLQATMSNTGNGLNCAQFGVTFPFKVSTNAGGAVTAASFVFNSPDHDRRR